MAHRTSDSTSAYPHMREAPTETAGMQRRKLIETALPLDAINRAVAREKSIRHGHPSALHLWWARRPLAVARAVIFAQMIDDPSEYVDELLSDREIRCEAMDALQGVAEPETAKGSIALSAGASDVPSPVLPDEATDMVSLQAAGSALRQMVEELERERLFKLMEALVLWENTTNDEVLEQARAEIWRSWRRACNDNCGHPRAREIFDRDELPTFHDPFAGGGALPLEAQRLGLDAHAGDLNPVAVLISKATIEIPPRFAGRSPVNLAARRGRTAVDGTWCGSQGIAEDLRCYGRWIRDEAERRIGPLYPKVEITAEMVCERPDLKPFQGRRLNVVAWLWARTVESPQHAFAGVHVPLASTFMLCTRKGREAYVEPVIEGQGYRFAVKVGKPADPHSVKAGTRVLHKGFRCLLSGVPIPFQYIDGEADAGRMKTRLMAIVVAGGRTRIYLSPSSEAEAAACDAKPIWKPETPSRGVWTGNVQARRHGFRTIGDYFTPRQLVALTTFSDLVTETMARIRCDAAGAGLPDDGRPLRDAGEGAAAYAEALAVYLACVISRLADRGSTICTWSAERESIRSTFARQGVPMTWDYAELNPLLGGTGSFLAAVNWVAESIDGASVGPGASFGVAVQADATRQTSSTDRVVSTDPPFYDNVAYADLSDFFHVWLRRTLRAIFPDLFSTPAVPKDDELVVAPWRRGSRGEAEAHYLDGMSRSLRQIAEQSHPDFPVTICYTLGPPEQRGSPGTASLRWEALVDLVVRSGFTINRMWPLRNEAGNPAVRTGAKTSPSGVVLVCRRRPGDAPVATRHEFLAALGTELRFELRLLQSASIAPADITETAIGPGMAVYTRYARVLGTDGLPMPAHEALALINQTFDEALTEQESDLDAASRWAVAWFARHGFEAGDREDAAILCKARETTMGDLVQKGILQVGAGQARLLRPEELRSWRDFSPDGRLSVWEAVHHLVREMRLGGEVAAAVLLGKLRSLDAVRALCYRLHGLCERGRRVYEAQAYNGLVQCWPEVSRLARTTSRKQAARSGGGIQGTP